MCGAFADERTRTIERLHARCADALRQRCLLLLGDTADAEDAFQETFLQAIGELASSRAPDGSSLFPADRHLAWISAVATRTCLRLLRTRPRPQPRPIMAADGAAHDLVRVVAGRQIVERLLRQLDDRTLVILARHVLDGDSQGQIARQLGISRRAVVKRLTKLRLMIDSFLSDNTPRR